MLLFRALLAIAFCGAICDAFVSPVVQSHGAFPTGQIPFRRPAQPQPQHSAQLQATVSISSTLLRRLAVSRPSIADSTVMLGRLITQSLTPMRALALILAGALIRLRLSVRDRLREVSKWWSSRGGGSFERSLKLWGFSIFFLFKYYRVERLKTGDKAVYSAAQTAAARYLTLKLLELGPTFIKVGQVMSTRIDVLPEEYINELCLLQDQVPGFPGDLAVSIIERELGRPIDQLYDSFDRNPIAAASLGQVHRATLNGRQLAVKVQRQGLKDLFDMDMKNIKVLAQLMNRLDPKAEGASSDWVSICDESARLLYREIDYNMEAQNGIRFRENFANVPWVRVPEVFPNMTTGTILTMEYVPGIKINNIEKIEEAGIDRELLAKRSAESYLTQICRHGFFHCDPHPGNVACDAVEGGRLIYYDFGMMDELRPDVKKGLVDLIFAIYESNAREACDALETIEVLSKGSDRVSVEKIARSFLQEFAQGIKPGEKWPKNMSKEEQDELRRRRRVQLGADFFSVGTDTPFRFPPTFTFVFRAFSTLDGIGKGLDPKYDLTRLARPFLKELVDLKDGSATITFWKNIGKQLGLRPVDIYQAVTQPRRVARVEDTITRMEQGDLKVRVRVLESEKAFKRMEIAQGNMITAVAAGTFLNLGVMLASSSGGQLSLAAKGALALAGVFGVQVPLGLLKLRKLDKSFEKLIG
mmetsp:Transcript_10521/g.23356  ORF Transcript_10521/g.23356 Transcript_10521/m.23356 type:complete len:700 (+) Transcript_10521:107-2206(+)